MDFLFFIRTANFIPTTAAALTGRWARFLPALGLLLASGMPAGAVTVSGRVMTDGGAALAGVSVRIDQVGGENAPWVATTAADGTWSVSDGALFGNLLITPTKAGFVFDPGSIQPPGLVDGNLSGRDFTARSAGQIEVLLDKVLDGHYTAVAFPAGPLALPAVRQGGSSVVRLRLKNTGSGPLTDVAVSLGGASASVFSITTSVPAALAAGASADVDLHASGDVLGRSNATLTLTSSDSKESPFVIPVQFETVSLRVSNTGDSGAGSLRAALANAAMVPGDDVLEFDPALSGGTIPLGSEIVIGDAGAVVMDVMSLPGRLTVEAAPGVPQRLFSVVSGPGVTFRGLTLRGGNSPGNGGALNAAARVTMEHCTLTNNVAALSGGAVAASSFLTMRDCEVLDNGAGISGGGVLMKADLVSPDMWRMERCVVAGNHAGLGGGVHAPFLAVLDHCILTQNAAAEGGALAGLQSGRLDHCTITGNSSSSGIGGFFCTGTVTAAETIIYGNEGLDVDLSAGFVILEGKCLFGSVLQPQSVDNPALLLTGDPKLGKFGYYGGLHRTIPLRKGSVCINAGGSALIGSTDLRGAGFPRQRGTATDLGVYETGNAARNFAEFMGESLPPGALTGDFAEIADFDGDGADNVSEWVALTDPADSASVFGVTPTRIPGAFVVQFRSTAGRRYLLETSSLLGSGTWEAAPGVAPIEGDGTDRFFVVLSPGERQFFRVRLAIPQGVP